MPLDDKMQVAVFGAKAQSPDNGGLPVEMGGGQGNLIRIFSLNWTIDAIIPGANTSHFIGLALSSDPEHEPTGAGAFDVFHQHKALYGRAIWIASHTGVADTTVYHKNIIVPLYGLVRPRRQILVWSILNDVALTGFNLEIYYQPFSAPGNELEEVNRKYGRYRRS